MEVKSIKERHTELTMHSVKFAKDEQGRRKGQEILFKWPDIGKLKINLLFPAELKLKLLLRIKLTLTFKLHITISSQELLVSYLLKLP